MPTIQQASVPVTSFPNEYTSPFANDSIVPLYSSVPLKSPIQGCLPCVVCGNSIVRTQVISSASNFKTGISSISTVPTLNTNPNAPNAPLDVTCEVYPSTTTCIAGTITVSWVPPTYHGIYPIEGFNIYVDNTYVGYSSADVNTATVCARGIVSSSVINVTAFNQIGESVKSTSITFGHVPGFPGLITPTSTFKYLTQCDWDQCLYSQGIHDSFVADGVTYTNPDWPRNDGNANPGHVVDGHMTWLVESGGNATCIDATGGLIDRIGNTSTIDNVYVNWPGTVTSNITKIWCGPGAPPSGCCDDNTLIALGVVLSNSYSSSTYH